jgi:hypothetical protein
LVLVLMRQFFSLRLVQVFRHGAEIDPAVRVRWLERMRCGNEIGQPR